MGLYFRKFHVLLKSLFCPPVVPQALEGRNFFVPSCPSGTTGGQKQLFLGLKTQEYKNIQLKSK